MGFDDRRSEKCDRVASRFASPVAPLGTAQGERRGELRREESTDNPPRRRREPRDGAAPATPSTAGRAPSPRRRHANDSPSWGTTTRRGMASRRTVAALAAQTHQGGDVGRQPAGRSPSPSPARGGDEGSRRRRRSDSREGSTGGDVLRSRRRRRRPPGVRRGGSRRGLLGYHLGTCELTTSPMMTGHDRRDRHRHDSEPSRTGRPSPPGRSVRVGNGEDGRRCVMDGDNAGSGIGRAPCEIVRPVCGDDVPRVRATAPKLVSLGSETSPEPPLRDYRPSRETDPAFSTNGVVTLGDSVTGRPGPASQPDARPSTGGVVARPPTGGRPERAGSDRGRVGGTTKTYGSSMAHRRGHRPLARAMRCACVIAAAGVSARRGSQHETMNGSHGRGS